VTKFIHEKSNPHIASGQHGEFEFLQGVKVHEFLIVPLRTLPRRITTPARAVFRFAIPRCSWQYFLSLAMIDD